MKYDFGIVNFYRFRRKFSHLRNDFHGVSKFTNLMTQQRILPILRRYFDEDVIPVMNVEINNACNYKCPFCPQSSAPRPNTVITKADFFLIVEQLIDIDFSSQILLSVNNEPFLHPLIYDFCEILSKRVPKAKTIVFSNGSCFTRDLLLSFARLDNPPLIFIDDYTPDNRIIGKFKGFRAEQEIFQTELLIEDFRANRLSDEPDFVLESYRKNLTILLKDRSWNESLSNRAGSHPTSLRKLSNYKDLICTWPFFGLFVSPSLKSFLCCGDYKQTVIMGDLRKEGIMNIWRGEKYRNVRECILSTKRVDLPLCSKCDAEAFFLPRHCVTGY